MGWTGTRWTENGSVKEFIEWCNWFSVIRNGVIVIV